MNLPPRFSLIDVYLSSTSLQNASNLIISAAEPTKPSVYVNVFAVDSVLKCHKNKEIAEMIGKPQGTVSSKLHRTYAKLREMLGGENNG